MNVLELRFSKEIPILLFPFISANFVHTMKMKHAYVAAEVDRAKIMRSDSWCGDGQPNNCKQQNTINIWRRRQREEAEQQINRLDQTQQNNNNQ